MSCRCQIKDTPTSSCTPPLDRRPAQPAGGELGDQAKTCSYLRSTAGTSRLAPAELEETESRGTSDLILEDYEILNGTKGNCHGGQIKANPASRTGHSFSTDSGNLGLRLVSEVYRPVSDWWVPRI